VKSDRLPSAANFLPLRKLPVRSRETTGVAVGIALEIILVLRLGFPEIADRCHLGHDFARPEAGGVHVDYGVFRDTLLLIICVEDRRAISRADIVALAIARRRIMDLKEEFQQIAIADRVWIEHDLDRLVLVHDEGGAKTVAELTGELDRLRVSDMPLIRSA
jgi:hypothetical protein